MMVKVFCLELKSYSDYLMSYCCSCHKTQMMVGEGVLSGGEDLQFLSDVLLALLSLVTDKGKDGLFERENLF